MRAAAESVLFYDGVTDEENLKVLGEKLQLDAIISMTRKEFS